MLEYKGYTGTIEADTDTNLLYGEVVGLKDVITYQAYTIESLKQAFQDSVDDYLEFCRERNEEPDKPFSGKFVVRLDPELHKFLFTQAKLRKMSLNNFIVDKLKQA